MNFYFFPLLIFFGLLGNACFAQSQPIYQVYADYSVSGPFVFRENRGRFFSVLGFTSNGSVELKTSTGRVLKINSNGKQLNLVVSDQLEVRKYSISPLQSNAFIVLEDMAIMGDSIFLVGSYSGSYALGEDKTPILFEQEQKKGFVLVINKNGNVLWVKTLSGNGKSSMDKISVYTDEILMHGRFFGEMVCLEDNKTIVKKSLGGQDAFWVLLKDSGVFTQWHTIGGEALEEIQFADHFLGKTTIFGNTNSKVFFVDTLMAKGGQGNFLFSQKQAKTDAFFSFLEANTESYVSTGLVTSNGAMVLGGVFYGAMEFKKGENYKSKGYSDGFIFQMNKNFEVDWSLAFGSYGYDFPFALRYDGMGKIFMGLHLENGSTFKDSVSDLYGVYNWQKAILMLDAQGHVLWVYPFEKQNVMDNGFIGFIDSKMVYVTESTLLNKDDGFTIKGNYGYVINQMDLNSFEGSFSGMNLKIQKDHVHLNWYTNNTLWTSFIVQRQTKEYGIEDIGKVEDIGKLKNGAYRYDFVDDIPNFGMAQYRIKGTNKNNAFSSQWYSIYKSGYATEHDDLISFDLPKNDSLGYSADLSGQGVSLKVRGIFGHEFFSEVQLLWRKNGLWTAVDIHGRIPEGVYRVVQSNMESSGLGKIIIIKKPEAE